MPRVGRPSKLTPEIQAKIVEVISAGNYRVVAARAAGVSPRALAAWVAQGKRASCGVYYEFRHAVMRAEQDAEMRAVDAILKAAVSDPKYACWWLERKFPQRWSQNKQVIRDLVKRIRAIEERYGMGEDTDSASWQAR